MANPFEKWFKETYKKEPVDEGAGNESAGLRKLEERRNQLITSMQIDRHPDDARLLEDIERQIAELKGA